jgi:predicted metalloprotease
MDWRGQRQSGNIEDRRGGGGGSGGFGGGGPRMRLPIGGGGGGLGIGGVVVVLIIAWLTGINPLSLLDGSFDSGSGGGFTQGPEQSSGRAGTPSDEQGKFVAAVLGSTEDAWTDIFRANGKQYTAPRLVLFSGQTSSACGLANAAVGPFYCPGDQRVYLDTRFFAELSQRFGAPGDFAAAYVVAHEVGHHVQRLLGALGPQGAGSNERSVRIELQADCYAGIWAKYADGKGIVEVGDIDEALNAASQIGDDTLQRKAGGTVQPETFTHGTSAQRSRWFKRGYQSGRISDCDTLNASQL